MCTYKKKSKTQISSKVVLSKQVSPILQFSCLPKFKDPIPTIPFYIGDHRIERVLLDLGSSINFIPYSVYFKLGLGKLQPSNYTLQLVDRLVKVPRGRIDGVLVKVDKGFFPIDFVFLDMEPSHYSKQIYVIPGRPFLAIANATINCRSGMIDVSIMNMRIRLNVFNASSQPIFEDESKTFFIDMLDEIVDENLPVILLKDPLEMYVRYDGLEDYVLGNYGFCF